MNNDQEMEDDMAKSETMANLAMDIIKSKVLDLPAPLTDLAMQANLVEEDHQQKDHNEERKAQERRFTKNSNLEMIINKKMRTARRRPMVNDHQPMAANVVERPANNNLGTDGDREKVDNVV